MRDIAVGKRISCETIPRTLRCVGEFVVTPKQGKEKVKAGQLVFHGDTFFATVNQVTQHNVLGLRLMRKQGSNFLDVTVDVSDDYGNVSFISDSTKESSCPEMS